MPSAYKGNQPYIFISYAHKDSASVIPIIRDLQEQGYRIWFDEGIEAGTEWSNNIAAHLKDCSAFLFFASANSAKSENCLDEIAFAKAHQKPSLMIFLEDNVILPEGTEMQTARFQRMFYGRHASRETFIRKLCEATILDACREVRSMPQAAEPAVQKQPEKPVKKEEKPAAKKQGKSGGFDLLCIPCAILELAYGFLGPFALELLTGRTANPFTLFFLMLIPHIVIALINMAIIVKAGPKLKIPANELQTLGGEGLVCWGIATVMAVAMGVSAIEYQIGSFLRFLISLGLNAVPGAVTMFLYFMTIGIVAED